MLFHSSNKKASSMTFNDVYAPFLLILWILQIYYKLKPSKKKMINKIIFTIHLIIKISKFTLNIESIDWLIKQ